MKENTFQIEARRVNKTKLFRENGYYIYKEYLTVPYRGIVWDIEYTHSTKSMDVFKITDHFLEETFIFRLNKER